VIDAREDVRYKHYKELGRFIQEQGKKYEVGESMFLSIVSKPMMYSVEARIE
jgi:hypothetical protein